MIQRYGLTVLGVVIGLLFWPLEAIMHDFVFDKGDFIPNLLSHDPNELWMRTLITLAFATFGWLAQRNMREQHLLQERLIQSRDHLGQIIDSTYDAYVAIDEQGVVIGWNRSAEKMFGWLRQDAMGKDISRLIIPEPMRAAHRKGMQRYCESGIATMLYKPLHLQACHRDGSEFEVSMVITPLRSGDKQEFFAFIRRAGSAQDALAGDGLG